MAVGYLAEAVVNNFGSINYVRVVPAKGAPAFCFPAKQVTYIFCFQFAILMKKGNAMRVYSPMQVAEMFGVERYQIIYVINKGKAGRVQTLGGRILLSKENVHSLAEYFQKPVPAQLKQQMNVQDI